MIKIEIGYALPVKQFLHSLFVSEGCTVVKAIMVSGLLEQFPDLQLNNNVGIFSKKVPLNHILKEGDRIEIYRPLLLSPNEARLLRHNNIRASMP